MILEIKDLFVEYFKGKTKIPALRNVSLFIESGESLGLVGESGCGKSTLALSILKLIGKNEGKISSGQILFTRRDLISLSEEEMREIRGKDISIIFQDPFTSLNPVIKTGKQIEEALSVHQEGSSRKGPLFKEKTLSLLKQVRIKDPERIYDSYPHQVSGGQRQRAMIAMAIANHPQILIADEPTTALDVTVQKEILELLLNLRSDLRMTLLFITHNLGIVANYTDRLVVLYAGEIVEDGRTQEILANPQHPYTQALLRSLPGRSQKKEKDKRKRLEIIPGSPPDPTKIPSGCIFHPRCPVRIGRCESEAPKLRPIGVTNRRAACHLSPFEKP